MKYKGYTIHFPTSGGKAGRGRNVTSTVQLRTDDCNVKQIRYTVDQPDDFNRALAKAKTYVDAHPLGLKLNQRRFLEVLNRWLTMDQPNKLDRQWLRSGGVTGYFRLTTRWLNGVVYDLANIDVPLRLRGKGTLKMIEERLLHHTQRQAVFVESVCEALRPHYTNPANKWTPVTAGGVTVPVSFFKLTAPCPSER